MRIHPAPEELGNSTLTNVDFVKILLAILVHKLGVDELKLTQEDFDKVARKYLLAGEDSEGFYLKLVNTLEEALNANSKPN